VEIKEDMLSGIALRVPGEVYGYGWAVLSDEVTRFSELLVCLFFLWCNRFGPHREFTRAAGSNTILRIDQKQFAAVVREAIF
jgi:hypothetical protein